VKVLLVHNYYRSGQPGGEDVAFRQERELLESAGTEVVTYTRSNDEVGERDPFAVANAALGLRWSRRTLQELGALIRSERPQVAHFHNTFPLISASGYAACRTHGVPVVQTLHNYRLVCAAGTYYRRGAVCELCRPGSPWPAVRHRCYRSSAAASLGVSWMLWRHWRGGVYASLVDRYVVLTRFAAGRLAQAGVSADRIVIKPNFVAGPAGAGTGDGGYAVFTGRLWAEKGVRTLLEAWRELRDVPLKVLGDGPLMAELAGQVRAEGLPVEFFGMRPRAEVLAIVARAAMQVMPSECFEGMPLALLEAYASGVPVVAARIGSLEELVQPGETGLLFEPRDAHGLASRVRALRADPALRARLGLGARARYLAAFTPAHNLEVLLGIYRDLTEAPGHERPGSAAAWRQAVAP
jgi:glycosyltransferase involved in cell wall biosynthesis